MIGCRPGQIAAQERTDGDGITAPFGDAPLAGDVFKEADHEHFEIDDGINAWTAPDGRQ